VEPLAAAPQFEHWWPRKRTDDNPATSSEEIYPVAWSGVTDLLGHKIAVLVGQSRPRGDGRPRVTVFFDEYPEAEFAQSANRDGWASAIKVNGKSTLKSGDSIPELYRRSRLLPYQEATGFTGPGRTKGLALVIASDDMVSAVHHAAARWLGKRGHRLEPAALKRD